MGTNSPPETATGKIGNATLVIKYCAPSVRGRQIFGEGGRVMQDPTAPIWRAGANEATAFHTDADLNIGGLAVPKGDYTLYVNVKDPNAWELVINKQTGQWGTKYDASQDLGPGEDGDEHAPCSHRSAEVYDHQHRRQQGNDPTRMGETHRCPVRRHSKIGAI